MNPDIMIRAAMFAADAHRNQMRKYHAAPYIVHPARVASTLMTKGATPDLVAAAWLHDVVEDCGVDLSVIEDKFNARVKYYVWAMTNPSKQCIDKSRAERKQIDKLHWTRITSSAAQWLKAEDRLDNLRDAWAAPQEWREQYAKESEALIHVLTNAPDDVVADCQNVIDQILGLSE